MTEAQRKNSRRAVVAWPMKPVILAALLLLSPPGPAFDAECVALGEETDISCGKTIVFDNTFVWVCCSTAGCGVFWENPTCVSPEGLCCSTQPLACGEPI